MAHVFIIYLLKKQAKYIENLMKFLVLYSNFFFIAWISREWLGAF